jgi:hypothetical protein
MGGAPAAVLIFSVLGWGCQPVEQEVDPSSTTSTAPALRGAIFGRVLTNGGTTYEGPMRWGGDEEVLWGHYFNGSKADNPWAVHVTPEQLPKERISIGVFGIEFASWERPLDLGRPFMARFADLTRIERRGREIRVTLKSGTEFILDRYGSDDLADGLRIWDDRRGVVDLTEQHIRTVEFLSTPVVGPAPSPLHGTVRTRQGDFTGLLQWNRTDALAHDELSGVASVEVVNLRFDSIRSIARSSSDSSLVTLLDGREMAVSGTPEVGRGNRGVYVDDPRYGRVLVSWNAFERVDFGPGGTGPAYDDFPSGQPLRGSVTTLAGERRVGRLVYDLDESETTETLDAPAGGVDYAIPFGLIATIVPDGADERDTRRARLVLHGGEEVLLERSGDLGPGHAGLLVFASELAPPTYVPWADVERVDFDRPAEMYPATH